MGKADIPNGLKNTSAMPIMVDVTPLSRPSAQQRDQKSRGATMVEFALIATALFTLIFGIIEGSLAVRARNAVNNAVDDAARKGAVAGTSDDADWLILNQLVGRGAASAADIKYVVVYNASNGSTGVPTNCLAPEPGEGEEDVNEIGTPQPLICNVYGPTTINEVASNRQAFLDGELGTSWPASSRTSGASIGFLGVHIVADYEPIFNQISSNGNLISKRTVCKLLRRAENCDALLGTPT